MKFCKKCDTPQPLDQFSNDKSRADGLQVYCKTCISTYKKEYAAANKQKLQDYHKQYRKDNQTRLARYHKNYLQSGGDKIRKDYRDDNKERIKQLKANSETKRIRCKVASSLTGPEYTAWVSAEPKTCAYCGKDCISNFHVDHVEPLAQQGKHELANLVITCPPCNLSKGSKSLITFLAYKQLVGNEPVEVTDKKL